ncbi:MAG: fumarylacetoacetate hydrolase family protein [Acidimicrobiales bacterium]
MKLVTIRTENGTRAAIDFESHYRLTPYGDVAELLRAVEGDVQAIADIMVDERVAKDDVAYAPTVVTPTKVICLGLNYADHVAEMGRKDAGFPTLFGKFPDTLCGPYDDIAHPLETSAMDWEAELGVVIGRSAYRVEPESAEEHIAGFVVTNDISMRDFQNRTTQFLQGKMFERTTPVGPHLVTPDEVDGARDLWIRCRVDGEVMQESRTSLLISSIAAAISYISMIITLRPGDLILTGTPSGVGAGRNPKVFLRPGNVVETEIEGVGSLRNRIC